MWYGFHFFPPFAFFFGLMLLFVILRFAFFRRGGRYCHGWQDGQADAEALLKRRLVNGEITDEEYLRIKEILRK